jgi:hypothetical protein
MLNQKIKKIVFIASYMKSGNTWMRAMICSLLNKGDFELKDLKKIKLFSQETFFSKISGAKFQDNGNYDFNFISNNWINAQKIINENTTDDIKFFKTHSVRGVVNNNYFTNENVCKGYIYLIRDPRDIAISLSKHMNVSIDEAIDIMLFQKNFVTNVFKVNEAVCTWKEHVKSWISFKKVPCLIIKYEDMVKNNIEAIQQVVNFLKILYENKITINNEIINKVFNNTSFNNLQKLENKDGFIEATKKNNFFRKGTSEQWKTILSKSQKGLIERELKDLMQSLKYL